MDAGPFEPPPYPHDRLAPIIEEARRSHGLVVDLSIGTPCDAPPQSVMEALFDDDSAKGYPPSVGSSEFRAAVGRWFDTRLGVRIAPEAVGACVGTKEFVAGVPHLLRLRSPGRDTVLYPTVSYPTYAMGALLAGCRAVPVALDPTGALDLHSIADSDVERALCLWSNSPSNPTGALDDLEGVAAWGRAADVPVFSDECYMEFTWADRPNSPREGVRGPGATILSTGCNGVVSVNSLSKRSNLAGLRVGYYAGDEILVEYLNEVRKHYGLMVPGPVQRAAVTALDDQSHVDDQRQRYERRLELLARIFRAYGLSVVMPRGGFYLWIDGEGEDGWSLTERIARDIGVIVSPGEFYGPSATGFIRVAAVQPDELLDKIAHKVH